MLSKAHPPLQIRIIQLMTLNHSEKKELSEAVVEMECNVNVDILVAVVVKMMLDDPGHC